VVTDVVLPQMGLEVSEGTIVAFHVEVGAHVAEGDPLVELETDKAITDVVAPRDGIVVGLDAEVGDTVAVGATLLRLGDHADDDAAAAPAAAAPAAAPNGGERIRAAPVARRAAGKLGVTLEAVAGTGPRGRITLADVELAAAEGSNGAGERREPMSATRRAIARRMTESQQVPQFGLTREIDATWLLAEKRRLADAGPARVSVNDLLIQALAEAVVRNPGLAVAYAPDPDGGDPQLLRRDGVDVGLAVATDRGLLVPVIRRAHERPLAELVAERSRLVAAARSGRIDLAEMTGATVSLSSLAAFGVERFNAMLNPGESAILAVGRAVDRVVPRDRGVAVVPMVALTLTVDHRVVDGATGGHALADLAGLLEGGMTWRP
jgi:pyruvate dehydrogenase E2 component (dihydrolipoamide acetyltransferase)